MYIPSVEYLYTQIGFHKICISAIHCYKMNDDPQDFDALMNSLRRRYENKDISRDEFANQYGALAVQKSMLVS